MNIKKILLLSISFVVFQYFGFSQTIIHPSIGSKTHASLTIDSIVMDDHQTSCFLTIENQNSEGIGWFCADKNISLIENSSSVEHKLVKALGISVCPKAHMFKHKGERLQFELIFPVIKNRKGDIDIIENCSDNCFSLKDIVLNSELNREIRIFENAVKLYQEGRLQEALTSFDQLSRTIFQNENHYAYTLYILPVLYHKIGDTSKAKSAYQNLTSSDINQKAYFLAKIHEISFFRDLK